MNGLGDVGEQFVRKLDDYIVTKDKENQRQGSNCFKPSGIYSCKRTVLYEVWSYYRLQLGPTRYKYL